MSGTGKRAIQLAGSAVEGSLDFDLVFLFLSSFPATAAWFLNRPNLPASRPTVIRNPKTMPKPSISRSLRLTLWAVQGSFHAIADALCPGMGVQRAA